MAYIPSNAEWFLADLVIALEVEGDPRSVTHINTVLVRASTAEDAYTAAMKLGRGSEYDDVNPAGKSVSARFLGLRELQVVHDKLEHGAELFYSERLGLTPAESRALARSKDLLSAFAPSGQIDRPDYSSAKVVSDALALVRGNAPPDDHEA